MDREAWRATVHRVAESQTQQKRVSKRFVARQLGISYSALCSYEYGERNPSDEVKVKLSEFYDVPIGQLFFGK